MQPRWCPVWLTRQPGETRCLLCCWPLQPLQAQAGRASVQGMDSFKGLQLVARDLTTQRLPELAGKRVLVLGCGKSAVDACAAAAEVAACTTMLFRKVGRAAAAAP